MDGTDLALYTNHELITELMRRTTFLGVVVQAEDDCKNGRWRDEQVFKVHFNRNLDPAKTGRLLELIAEYIDQVES